MKLKKFIAPALIIALLITFYLPTFRWLIQSWLSNPYYTHGFLIPLVSGVIVWTKRRELRQAGPTNIGAIVLGLGFVLYILGYVLDMRFLTALSFLVVLGGLVLYFYGPRATRVLAFPLAFLIFMVPLPFMEEVGFSLQYISIHFSTFLLRTMGFSITTDGSEIILDNQGFNIGLPCSGINSLIALLALAALFAYLLSGPTYKRAILFVIAFPIAILANILRIVSIILIAHYGSMEFATGFYHDISSLIFFVIAFLFLVLLSRLMGCKLTIPVPKK